MAGELLHVEAARAPPGLPRLPEPAAALPAGLAADSLVETPPAWSLTVH